MNVPDEAITLADGLLRRGGSRVGREDVREALEAAAPLIAAAERQRIRQIALEQAAIFPDEGWSASVRSALQEFADLLDAPAKLEQRAECSSVLDGVTRTDRK